MKRQISFATKTGNTVHKLSLPKSLLGFAEFDLNYFWEQAIDFCKKYISSDEYPTQEAYNIRNLLKKCHPYFNAGINTTFDKIVLDCIIDYLCRSYQMGQSALWNKYISPKNPFEAALFSRLSEYRTDKAINQWVNMQRVQIYTRNKLEFVFDRTRNVDDAITRKRYFDLSFSVVSKELGCPTNEIGVTKSYNPCLLPNAVFMANKVSKDIYHRISGAIENVDSIPLPKLTHEDLSDQIAMDAYSHIKRLSRPADNELAWIRSGLEDFEEEIYLPCGFKAVIDLEFDKILQNNILLKRCASCGNYFEPERGYKGEYCTRTDKEGKSCRDSVSVTRTPELVIPQTLDERCEAVIKTIESKIGFYLDDHEYYEWRSYLESIKHNIQQGHSTDQELEAFLTYSLKLYSNKQNGEA